jgi:hypothetical protein
VSESGLIVLRLLIALLLLGAVLSLRYDWLFYILLFGVLLMFSFI